MKIISFKRNLLSNAIRSRKDVIDVILQANELLLCGEYNSCSDLEKAGHDKPFLYVDKMSRLFIPEHDEDKVYSIVFPFSFCDDDKRLAYNNGCYITSLLNAWLQSIMSSTEGNLESIEKVLEICWNEDERRSFGLSVTESELAISILTKLLTFDIGYIRYDHDEAHEDGMVHPLNHIDVNFENQSTYKIGLHTPIDVSGLHSILDSKQPCWFLNR